MFHPFKKNPNNSNYFEKTQSQMFRNYVFPFLSELKSMFVSPHPAVGTHACF